MNIRYTIAMKGCLLLAACCIGSALQAQGLSPAAMEQMKMKRLWLHSQNAAGTAFDDLRNYSDLRLSYDLRNGDYRLPQEGRKESTVGVASEGFINLGKAYVWGTFGFAQKNLTDAAYNASVADPFRGMPYYVADENLSKWRNQYYDLKFRAATPLLGNHWTLGVEGNYIATLAAKQRDPRVDTRFYTLQLMPGVAYRLNDRHRLGFNLKYTSIKEDSKMKNVNTYVDQIYYQLYGLGVAVKGIGYGTTGNYIGDRLGGALQYDFCIPSFRLLLEASYDERAETLQNSFDSPKKVAGVKEKTAQVSLTALKESATFTHYLHAAYLDRRIDGIQYISQHDNSESQSGWVDLHKNIRSTYDTRNASLEYALSRNRGEEYAWKVELGMDYLKQDDEYLMPRSVMDAENLLIHLGGKVNFAMGNKLNRRLLLDVHAARNNNLSGGYTYGGSHADYVTVTGLAQGTSDYQTTDYWRMGASLTYSQQVDEAKQMNLFGRLALDRVEASGHDYDGRTFFSVSLGCNF